jgi:DNA-directed RNA polymerase delta subunit
MSKYEEWQKLSNAYRKDPTEKTKKAAYDAFESYREEGIKEANKLTPAQEKARKEYLSKVAADNAEMASGNKNMKEASMNTSGYEYKKGGKVSSASKRADGCAVRGKTKGRIV